jgi:hypothetical protein
MHGAALQEAAVRFCQREGPAGSRRPPLQSRRAVEVSGGEVHCGGAGPPLRPV